MTEPSVQAQTLAQLILNASTEQKIKMRDKLLEFGDEVSLELAEQIDSLIKLNKMVN